MSPKTSLSHHSFYTPDLEHLRESSSRFLSRLGVIGCLASLALAGCVSENSGSFNGQSTAATVSLSQNNYQMLKPGATGSSTGFSLLGIPFSSPSYAQAKSMLYQSVGQSLSGRAIALANQTSDVSTVNLILFQIPTLTLTADVIEFTGSPSSSGPSAKR